MSESEITLLKVQLEIIKTSLATISADVDSKIKDLKCDLKNDARRSNKLVIVAVLASNIFLTGHSDELIKILSNPAAVEAATKIMK